MCSTKLKQSKNILLGKAIRIAALIEIPLFVSIVVLVFGLEKGPHSTVATVLMMTQIVGVIVMSVVGSMDSDGPVILVVVWGGIFAVQFLLIGVLAYLFLKSNQRNSYQRNS